MQLGHLLSPRPRFYAPRLTLFFFPQTKTPNELKDVKDEGENKRQTQFPLIKRFGVCLFGFFFFGVCVGWGGVEGELVN